jgi:hypothetical protein
MTVGHRVRHPNQEHFDFQAMTRAWSTCLPVGLVIVNQVIGFSTDKICEAGVVDVTPLPVHRQERSCLCLRHLWLAMCL